MTPETKAYLDQQFAHLEQRLVDITNPMKETLDRLRANIVEIYDRLRTVETAIEVFKDNKGSAKESKTNNIAWFAAITFLAVAVVGWLV